MAAQIKRRRDAEGRHVLRIPTQVRHFKYGIPVAPEIEKVVDVPPHPGTLTVTVAPSVSDPDAWKLEDGSEFLVHSPQDADAAGQGQ